MITIPGSKSITNRALVMAASTQGPVILHHPLYSEDTESMISCLRTLGLHIECNPDRIIVFDDISVIKEAQYELFAKDSGTTMRFLLALLTLVPGKKWLRGNPRLEERPLQPLINALQLLGAEIDVSEKGVQIFSSSLQKESVISLDSSLSSQFLSALLMIAPLCGGVTLHLTTPTISQPYVLMTLAMMRAWGIEVLEKESGFYIPKGQSYIMREYAIEGDYSSAAYFFAIASLTSSSITLQNLDPHSLQPDHQFLALLESMGNRVERKERTITIRGKELSTFSVNMEGMPDQVQTMAVLAAFIPGRSDISGVRSLRHKETDRIYALRTELAKMGIRTEEERDRLTIYGGKPHAAIIDTYGDHRMAMAFAVAKARLPALQIRNPEVVCKSFPTFWEQLKEL